ncbi:MAG: autotransporter domain-containing protein [Puniceicoccales bacterium]|jgi:uncharacterized protein with beta-barrel porin domain|nr:autotransporter domain-containing protein [Puniceicoccales bacterium]
MRLSKTLFLAAAGVLTFPAVATAEIINGNRFYTDSPTSYQTYLDVPDAVIPVSYGDGFGFTIYDARGSGGTLRNLSGSARIIVDKGTTLILNSEYSSTFNGTFFGEGNLVKNGTGSLEYTGFSTAFGDATSSVEVTSVFSLNGWFAAMDASASPHPGFGYFRNSTSIATYSLSELDPRSNYWNVENLGGDEYYVSGKTDQVGTLLMRNEGALPRSTVAHDYSVFPPRYPNFSDGDGYSDRTVVRAFTGPEFGITQLGDEPYAKILTRTGLYSIDFVRPTVVEGQVIPLEHVYYSNILIEGGGLLDDSLAFGGLSGTVTINAGELDVKGYLTHWREFPSSPSSSGLATSMWNYDAVQTGAGINKMVGVSNIVLNGSAVITFRNTELNITAVEPDWMNAVDTVTNPDPHAPNVIRLNFVHNLQTGPKTGEIIRTVWGTEKQLVYSVEDPEQPVYIGNFPVYEDVPVLVQSTIPVHTNDQYQTELEVGLSSEFRVVAHIDQYHEGSIGIISGIGRFFKTGPGYFSILNRSTLSGHIFLAGGQTILDPKVPDSTGSELLASVSSVNLVGSDGTRGTRIAPEIRPHTEPNGTILDAGDVLEFTMGYAPPQEVGSTMEAWVDPDTLLERTIHTDKYAQLVVRNDQTIHNLQVLFAESSGPTDALRTVESAILAAQQANPTEIFIAGQGKGTNIQMDTHTLTVVQEKDGVYRGNLNLQWSSVALDDQAGGVLQNVNITLADGNDFYDSNYLRRDLILASQAIRSAQDLLEQKRLNFNEVGSNSERYEILLRELEKSKDAFGVQTEDLNSLDATNVMDWGKVNLEGTDPGKIDNVVKLVRHLLLFSRDDYALFALGIETSAVKAFYDYLLDSKDTNSALEVWLGREIAAGEDRAILCAAAVGDVFGVKKGLTDIEVAKEILADGVKLTNAKVEAGNTIRYSTILEAVEAGEIQRAKQLFESAGTFEKKGPATLALLVDSAKIENLLITEGEVLANVQALGTGNAEIRAGVLKILQNTTGTLNASISGGADGFLVFTTRGYVTNDSGQAMLVGGDNSGSAFIRRRQDKFYGNVIIEEGVTVYLSAQTDEEGNATVDSLNDSFSNVNSLVIRGGESQRETTLSMNGTDQRIRNLSGDSYGRIRLGSGILVIDQEINQSYDGKFSGQGSFVKEGDGVFTLGGVSDFYGVTIARAGDLVLRAQNALEFTSAVIIKGGATLITSDMPQVVGALFGEKEAVIRIGSGGLTVGISDLRYDTLVKNDQSGSQGLLNMNYLATLTGDLKTPGGVNEAILYASDQSARAEDGTTVGFLSSSLVGLENAETMSYSGEIQGTGDLIKIGKERLTLDGVSPDFSGTTILRQGILRINADSINGSGIEINTPAGSATEYLELNASAGLSQMRVSDIGGSGDLHKVGKGEATIQGYLAYSGDTVVDEGRLLVTDVAGLGTSRGIVVKSSGVIVFDSSSSETYSGNITGTGGVEKRGSGKVTLTGSLSYMHNNIALTDGKTLQSFPEALPPGTTFENGIIKFPEGTTLRYDGVILLPDKKEVFIPKNLIDLAEPELSPGVYAVTARAAGLLVKKNDGSLIPLAADVTATPVGSELRESGVVVEPNGERRNTHGGVIVRGDDWESVWGEDGELSADVLYFIDDEAWITEKKALADVPNSEKVSSDKVDKDGNVDWLSYAKEIIVMESDGTLSLRTSGATFVENGVLEINNLPKTEADADGTPGEFEIGEKGTLTFRVSGAEQTLSSDLRGKGVFNKTGDLNLRIVRAQDEFEGRFSLEEGTVSFEAKDVLKNARDVYLGNGTTLNLAGDGVEHQLFHYIVGEEGSVINVNGASLTLDVAKNEGETRIYRGLLSGGGSLEKTGDGTLILWRPTSGENNQLDNIRVTEGVLQVAPVALGDASVHVATGTELRFYTTADDDLQNYTGALTGGGIVGKTGAGTVWLSGDNPLGDERDKVEFHIHEGRLIVDGSRVGDEVVPHVRIKDSATFQLNLSLAADGASRYLELGTGMVEDFSPGEHGNFAISGPVGTILTVSSTPLGYSGKTELIGGLELHFDGNAFPDHHAELLGGLSGIKVTNGDSVEAPIVHLGGALAVEFIQNLEGVFEGDFLGYSSGPQNFEKTNYGGGSGLIIKGPQKLVYRGSDGRGILPEGKTAEFNGYDQRDVDGRGVGNVKIDGGKFQVGVENLHTIDIANDGVLFVENNIDRDVVYTGVITNSNGSASVKSISTSGNAVVWDGSAFSYLATQGRKLTTFGVEEGSLARLSVNGGDDVLKVFPTESLYTNGTLEISVATGNGNNATLDFSITGAGNFRKTGVGSLAINGTQQYEGVTEVNGGALKGNFAVEGDIIVNAGGTLAPGNSIGTITTKKDLLLQGGVLEIEIDAANNNNDLFNVGGKVILNGGTIRVKPVSIEGATGGGISRGSRYTIAQSTTAGASLTVESQDWPEVITFDSPESNENFILLSPGIGAGTAYASVTGNGLTLLVGQKELARVPGYNAHKGLDGFHAALDTIATLPVPPFTDANLVDNFVAWYNDNKNVIETLPLFPVEDARVRFANVVKQLPGGLPARLPASGVSPELRQVYNWLIAAYEIGAYLNTVSDSALRPVVNNLSPLGYSSLVSMPATVASNNVDQLRSRIEQRRYDRSAFIAEYKWQTYFIGTSSIFKNGSGSDSVTHDFNTQGGIVGVDALAFEDGVLGGAVEYTNGSATLDDGGGKIKLNGVRATGYASRMLGNWFYVDTGLSGGYMSYEAKRNTVTGVNDASPEGWQAGAFAVLGSVIATNAKDIYFTPYIGAEYNHYQIYGFTEKGSHSRLKVDDFDYDSLRAKVGGSLSWASGGYDWNWKVSIDLSFAHELLETESDISSRFALEPYGLTKNTIHSKTLSRNVVKLVPSATLNLTEQTSVFASYSWEYGFEGETRHNLSVGVRFRF